jgi:hypothetical protein
VNTQTHILLASALFTKRALPITNMAIFLGAFLPDLPLYMLFAGARILGYSDNDVFGDFYWREPMRNIMGASHSFVVAGVIALAGYWYRERLWGKPAMFFAAAMALHAATDLPVHVDDGHRHFWPLSRYVFNSPVSYWDPAHYGNYIAPFEAILGIISAIVVMRRFRAMWIKVLCGLAIAAYVTVPAYFLWVFATSGGA